MYYMRHRKTLVLFCFVLLTVQGFLFAQTVEYLVNAKDLKSPIQPTMWGLFFEDINRGADGGLYAELVKNRSFDFPDPLMGWIPTPSRSTYARNDIFQVINQSNIKPSDPKYLQVTVAHPDNIFLRNESFGGLTVGKTTNYDFILLYRQHTPGLTLAVDIVNAAGRSVGGTRITPTGDGSEWKTQKVSIVTTDTTVNGKLVIKFEGTGKLDINRVSLFPVNTFKNREGGLRTDLAQKLADIQPGFMRFPGGCIVEGKTVENRYQWKNTIGKLEDRTLLFNQWNDANPKKILADYYQSFGLGFYEYFQLCEDLKTEPMPILNCGISCQFDAAEVVPMDQIDPYVKDALDLIEFANGSVKTKWGKKRSEMGHVEPFNMKLLGIGNENWGPQYLERLQLFTKAIKAKYPSITLVASTGYSPNPQFRYMDSALRKDRVDVIDEHYYQTPNWFMANSRKYDHYDRQGPKIFIGEYACHSVRIGSQDNVNTQYCALAEAAWMTGLERNADIVTMAAYAPLFAHVNDWQWTPNLIWFDNAKSYATPSYYVQQMFATNKGTDVVPITENGDAIAGQDSVWASAVIDKRTNELIVKLVNPSSVIKTRTIVGVGKKEAEAKVTTLQASDRSSVNSLDNPYVVVPTETTLTVYGDRTQVTILPYSFTVVKIKI
jgi:alpha-N-arabinofuranosidase